MSAGGGPREDREWLDRITNIDNILNDSLSVLRSIRDGVQDIDPRIVAENVSVRGDVPRTAFQLEMSKSVPPASSEDVIRDVPFDGWVKTYVVGFPDGADQAVGVRLADGETGNKWFPRNPEDQYFAANNFTYPFDLVFPVEEGDKLKTQYLNNDPNNSHFINSMVTITEKMPDEMTGRVGSR